MKNIVFTIVAKNFLPFARTLGDSIFRLHKEELDYIIFLVDETEKNDNYNTERFKILETRMLNIEGYHNMAFWYDVTEFSTALKPYIISYLFKQGFNKIIYFDPDIYVYNPLTSILNELEKYIAVITPHINYPIDADVHAVDEETLLFHGVYNLGFAAFRNDKLVLSLLDWWKKKLYNSCFIDKSKSTFVDQKWMNFVNAFLGKSVLISRNPGYNMAVWNLHERKLKIIDNNYIVTDKSEECFPLVFYHFSGYHPSNKEYISYKQRSITFEMFPELKKLFDGYRAELFSNGAPDEFLKPYIYGTFKNGENITKLQRRLFSSLIQEGVRFTDPFSVDKNSFYDLLKKNRLLSKTSGFDPEKIYIDQIQKYSKKIKLMNFFLRLLQRFVGIEKYTLFLRFLSRTARYDLQLFLIKKTKNF